MRDTTRRNPPMPADSVLTHCAAGTDPLRRHFKMARTGISPASVVCGDGRCQRRARMVTQPWIWLGAGQYLNRLRQSGLTPCIYRECKAVCLSHSFRKPSSEACGTHAKSY